MKHREYVNESCIDRMYEIVVAIYRRAIRDARRGNKEAIDFLDVTAPDWRERCTQRKPRLRRQAVRA